MKQTELRAFVHFGGVNQKKTQTKKSTKDLTVHLCFLQPREKQGHLSSL